MKLSRLPVVALAICLGCGGCLLPSYSPIADKKLAGVVEYFQDIQAEAIVTPEPLKYDERKRTEVLRDIEVANTTVGSGRSALSVAHKSQAIVVDSIGQCRSSADKFFNEWKASTEQKASDAYIRSSGRNASDTCLTALEQARSSK